MNAEQLLAHYERVAEAPDAIARLRRFIIELAVRGKLVPQDPADESASLLLKRIMEARAQLVAAGEIRKEKPTPNLEADEVPYACAPGWIWSRIRQVTSDRGQTTPETDFTYVDVTAINKEIGEIEGASVVAPADAPSRARKRVSRGDVLYSCVRPYLLNIAVVNADLVPPPIASTAFAVLNGYGLVLPRYQWIVLRSPFFVECVEAKMRGQAYPAINDSDFALLPFPLPPLAEQHRIVAKVNELMALCDRLEAARSQREATRDRLTAATLARLNTLAPAASPDGDAPKASSFQSDARFALSVLPALTSRPEQIVQLRRTVLDMAIRGKLVKPEVNDLPARTALEHIASERLELIRNKIIRNEELPPTVLEDAIPFQVPSGWSWARVGHIFLFTQYGTSQKAHPSSEGVPVLAMGNIQNGKVIWDNEKRISSKSDDLPALFLKKFDLLYNRTNSAELVGKTGIYLGSDDTHTFASYLIRLRSSLVSSNPMYLNLAMNAPFFRATQIAPLIKKQTGQANVNGTALKNMLIPLPPLAEQCRIVTKVNELMSLCDQLEASLSRGECTRSRLLDALLHEALQPSHDNVVNFDAARKRLIEKRQAIGCRIVERLSRTKGFGRTRAVKPFYWAEAHCGIALGGRWGRGNFGPFDQWIMSFESDAASADWFSCIEHSTSDGSSWIEYRPGSQLATKAKKAAQVLDSQAVEFERVLTLLAGLDTEKTEIVTTLFAAWNDLLIEGKPVSDSIVITEMREHWHPSKSRFTSAQLQPWLDWLRQNDLVPKGLGPCTRHQTELL